MRYIGSKANLLERLTAVITPLAPEGGVFLDVFGGTGVVGRHLKERFTVHANDFLYFSFALLVAGVKLNKAPQFRGLGGEDPYHALNALDPERFDFEAEPFVFQEFSPGGPARRQYFREETALRIDAMRQQIVAWRRTGAIDEEEALVLCAALVSSVPSVSNIAGTYGAYLKHWDQRTSKPLVLTPAMPFDNGRENGAHWGDGNEVVKRLSGDVLYVDPPYNGRQYLSYYHVLETIALYDAPELRGKTGVRVDPGKSSDFCRRALVASAFTRLVAAADFGNIVVSYSTEGLMDESEIVRILHEDAGARSVAVHRIPYRRYSRVRTAERPSLEELIVVAER